MKTWAQQGHATHVHERCASCGHPIVLVPQVGWVLDLRGADTYDLCESNPFANHVPSGSTRQGGDHR